MTGAQIIYDSPPIGVSLTRPVLPWLARYFVGAGERELIFLDEPQRGPLRPAGGGGSPPGGGVGGSPGGGVGGSPGGGVGGSPGGGVGGGPGGGVGVSLGGGQPPAAAQGPARGGLAAEAPATLRSQYMAPVPVPVLSAPVLPPKYFLPPQAAPPRLRFDIARIGIASPGAVYPITGPSFPANPLPPIFESPLPPPASAPSLPVPAFADFALPDPSPPVPIATPFFAPAPASFAVPYQPVNLPPLPYEQQIHAPSSAALPLPPPLATQWAIPVQNNVLTNGSLEPKSPKLFFRDVILGGAMPPQPPVKGRPATTNRMSKFNG
ncbi:hypothetical protein GPALN_011203 [Globodera pallida]|nr:hypothetical protein GPALN_011203 [Globodera pallida]